MCRFFFLNQRVRWRSLGCKMEQDPQQMTNNNRFSSRRMKDRYDIFGGLPDTIEDEWIESIEKLEEMMDEYIHLRQQARNVFEMRYQEIIDPDKDRWELCSRVLSRRDVVDRLSAPW